ncbi:MAG: hypothetical protein VX910_03870 [Candidatus Latescibacterota bacterium]|nr:hypothetical protein [Candidatus Latescibacterota bacterium]
MKRLGYALCLFTLTLIASSAHSQVSLDLNTAPGDQGEHERMVKPGETFAVELLATGGAEGAIGFSAKLRYDGSQISFKGFSPGGLMAGAMAIPPKAEGGVVDINAALFGKQSPDNAGSLGKLTFEAGPTVARVKIDVESASFGTSAGVVPTGAGHGVKLVNPDAQGVGSAPPMSTTGPGGDPNMPPQGHMPPPGGHSMPPMPPTGGGFNMPPGGHNMPPQGHMPPPGGHNMPPMPPQGHMPPPGGHQPGPGGDPNMPPQGHMPPPGGHYMPPGGGFNMPPGGHQPGPGGDHGDHDAPPSPQELKAMDAGLRMRIAKLPAHLKARASKVQDLHMKFVTGMTNGDPGNDKNGKAFFQSAIKFMQGLAKDPAATSDPAVHEMIHFLANDFGKGDLPTDIPTATLIEGEIGHLKGWAADFRGPRGGDPNRGPQGGPPQGSHGYSSGDGSHGYTSGDGSHGYSPRDGYPGQ